jgi:hypothetical protein
MPLLCTPGRRKEQPLTLMSEPSITGAAIIASDQSAHALVDPAGRRVALQGWLVKRGTSFPRTWCLLGHHPPFFEPQPTRSSLPCVCHNNLTSSKLHHLPFARRERYVVLRVGRTPELAWYSRKRAKAQGRALAQDSERTGTHDDQHTAAGPSGLVLRGRGTPLEASEGCVRPLLEVWYVPVSGMPSEVHGPPELRV